MRPCTKVGIDVTWRCNWRCRHCFYRHDDRLHQAMDTPMEEIEEKLCRAAAGGLDHAVLVGYGEPTLCPNVGAIVDLARRIGLACSIITNGTAPLGVYEDLVARGLDHLHISSHGPADAVATITGSRYPEAWARQAGLKTWMRANWLPYRTNITMQRLNYKVLAETMAWELKMGAWQMVLLGFLPHYGWGTNAQAVRDVAVHPAELRPHLEAAAGLLLEAGARFSIRYHPLCHMAEEFWPYVTNARYVFFDPFEWNYTLDVRDPAEVWKASVRCGESVTCGGGCRECAAYRHCGGWNRVYAAVYDGADLRPIKEAPARYAEVWERDGGLFDLNPTNAHSGTLQVKCGVGSAECGVKGNGRDH